MRGHIHEVEMAVPQEIKRLVERYEAQREAYESGQYKETQNGGNEGVVPAKLITSAPWEFAVGPAAVLLEALDKWPAKLGDIAARMAQGIRTSANEVYVLDLVRESGSTVTAHSRILDRDVRKDHVRVIHPR